MRFVLLKENIILKVKFFDSNYNSYSLKIDKDKFLNLTNQELIDKYLLLEVMEKLDSIIKRVLSYLTEEEDDSAKTGLLYDDLARVRSIILKKYEKHLSDNAVQEYMKIIRFLATELKKRLVTYNIKEVKAKSR